VFTGVSEKSCISRYFFGKFYAAQCNAVRNNLKRDETADKKAFIPLRNKIGMGKTRLIITGAAPCPPYLLEFLKVVVGALVVQGYGMTETAAATNISMPDDPNVGHVGPPLPSNEIKLRDVQDMGYLSTNNPPTGEVLVRGANIFGGYFKNEKATSETLDKDGWISTGDIGRWNPNGSLSIIDRKKNLFKLSQGEYIAAEKIEVAYGKAPVVGQIWVYGNSYKSFCLAVVVPAADVIANYCHTNGWWPKPKDQTQPGTTAFAEDFVKVWEGPNKAALKKHVFDTMVEYAKELKGFERLTDIVIEYHIDNMMQGFTEANECLTPTFKLRRPYLLKRYKDPLKELYATHGEPNKPDEKWPGEP
jgi:long-chain acyl-CoA synthetase